jgi:hypothetical protein
MTDNVPDSMQIVESSPDKNSAYTAVKTTTFFIPNAEPDKWEGLYEAFAAMAHRAPLPDGQRIYSISFMKGHAETWTATVGKKLSGKQVSTRGRGSNRREFTKSLSDGATVLAIFSGVPYTVVTDRGLEKNITSDWVNPFGASEKPTSVSYFDLKPSLEDVPPRLTE